MNWKKMLNGTPIKEIPTEKLQRKLKICMVTKLMLLILMMAVAISGVYAVYTIPDISDPIDWQGAFILNVAFSMLILCIVVVGLLGMETIDIEVTVTQIKTELRIREALDDYAKQRNELRNQVYEEVRKELEAEAKKNDP